MGKMSEREKGRQTGHFASGKKSRRRREELGINVGVKVPLVGT